MRKPELKRITAALRQLAPDQRKSVAAELAALDAQPASTGRFAYGAARTVSLCTFVVGSVARGLAP